MEYVRCLCVWRGWIGGEWMRGLGFGFTNPVGTRGVFYVCFGCGVVGGECVGGLAQGLEGWCCVSCESGFSV